VGRGNRRRRHIRLRPASRFHLHSRKLCVPAVVVLAVGCREGGIVAGGNTYLKIRDRLCTCISQEESVAMLITQLKALIVRVHLFATLPTATYGLVTSASFRSWRWRSVSTGTRETLTNISYMVKRLAIVSRTAASRGSKNNEPLLAPKEACACR
jgi:hypothetical protein